MRSPSYFLGHSLSPLEQLNKERRGEEERRGDGKVRERAREKRGGTEEEERDEREKGKK